MRCSSLAESSLDLVEKGEMTLSPDFHKDIWNRWLCKTIGDITVFQRHPCHHHPLFDTTANCHDWCISRQLWWGHRIPAYLVKAGTRDTNPDRWVVARSEEDAKRQAIERFNLAEGSFTLEQV